jgi:hypothetical protein
VAEGVITPTSAACWKSCARTMDTITVDDFDAHELRAATTTTRRRTRGGLSHASRRPRTHHPTYCTP